MTDRHSAQSRVEPRDENDPFCTCPSCGLLGTHAVGHTVFRTRKDVVGDGEVVEVVAWGMPPDGTPMVERTCVFCAHEWSVRRDPG